MFIKPMHSLRRLRSRALVAALLAVFVGVPTAAWATAARNDSARSSGHKSDGASNTLTIAMVGTLTANVDPVQHDTTDHDRIQQGFEAWLVQYPPLPAGAKTVGAVTDLAPDLAKSWKITPQGIVFTLRSNAKSQYGNPLTPADVVWSFKRAEALAPLESILWKTQVGVNVKNPVTVLGPHEVRINATKPGSLSPIALAYLGNAQVPLVILDAKVAKQHATKKDPWAEKWLANHSASFGPYKVTSIAQNNRVTLSANPYYYGPAPAYNHVIIGAVSNTSAAQELVSSGQVQAATNLPDPDLAALRSKRNVNVVIAPEVNVQFLALNKKVSYFTNLDVRKAIWLAINRKALASGPYAGLAIPAHGILPTSQPGVNEPKALPYNLTEAKALMAASPYPHGFTTTIAASTDVTPEVDLNSLLIDLKADLAQIGINVTVDDVASGAAFESAVINNTYPMFLSEDEPAEPDIAGALDVYFNPNGGASVFAGNDNDPALTAAIEKAVAAKPGPARINATNEAGELFSQAYLDPPLAQTETGYALGKSVCGFHPNTNGAALLFQYLKPCS